VTGPASALTITGLAGATTLHVLWAAGSSFPAASRRELAELVAGSRRFPSTSATIGVAGLLATATVATAAQAGHLEPVRRRVPRLVRAATAVASVTLLARGAAGLAIELSRVTPTPSRFRKWDLALYSPLCLALGLGAASAARSNR
jgi:hypothetical protein